MAFNVSTRRHMWVEFVVGSLPCYERFFSGYSGFPLSSKTNISKFQFDQESGRRRTTMWMCYLQIVIYFILFIYLFIYRKPSIKTPGGSLISNTCKGGLIKTGGLIWDGGLFNLVKKMVWKSESTRRWRSCSWGSKTNPNFKLVNKPSRISPQELLQSQ